MWSPGDSIGVAVVDAAHSDRERLAHALAREPDIDVVGATGDARGAIELVVHTAPDVVVMDLGLPRVDALHATREVTHRERPPSVLALADPSAQGLALDAIRAGAAGLCAKSATPAALAGAVRVVAAGHAVVERAVLRELLDDGTADNDALEHITPRERQVMALVAEGATNPEVSQRLVISDATVRTHVRSLRRKLGARNRAELVSRVFRLGLTTTSASPEAATTYRLRSRMPAPLRRASPSGP